MFHSPCRPSKQTAARCGCVELTYVVRFLRREGYETHASSPNHLFLSYFFFFSSNPRGDDLNARPNRCAIKYFPMDFHLPSHSNKSNICCVHSLQSCTFLFARNTLLHKNFGSIHAGTMTIRGDRLLESKRRCNESEALQYEILVNLAPMKGDPCCEICSEENLRLAIIVDLSHT